MTKRSRTIFISAAFMLLLLCASLSVFFYRSRLAVRQNVSQYDVVVVGAGPGGIGASIQAARLGMRVALLEPTDWIGGQMTAAGVGNMDEGSTAVRQEGLYSEFVQKATDYYRTQGTAIGTCYGGTTGICVDPRVGQLILKQMLQQESKNLQVFTGTQVTRVIKNGNVVGGVAAGNRVFSARVVIDADEYGDVLAMAGADYRLGNGTNIDPKTNACIQKLTYTAVIKKYTSGVPDQLTFHQPPPGYTPAVAAHLQKSFARGFPWVVAFRGFPDPPNPSLNTPPGTPQTITRTSVDLESANDYPASGVLSTKFIDDPKYRADAICQAKLLTLQTIYFMQHDLGQKDWSIANDEGYDTAYNRDHHCANLNGFEAFENQMSQEPYVREGRRIIGTETLTGHELAVSWEDPKNIVTHDNSIAVGYYPMDIHECRTANTLESQFDALTDSPRVHKGGPFEVPMGVLIPKYMDGLLAAEKNISTSRFANGAVREQPVSMDIGQAAGALAALAVKHNEQPRQVAAADVQAVLTADNLKTTRIK